MISSLECELKIFWDACAELNERVRRGACQNAISDILDEIRAISEYTEWPALKRACRNTLLLTELEMRVRAVRA